MTAHLPRCPRCGGRVSPVELESGAIAGEHCNLCGRSWSDYDQERRRANRWRNQHGLSRLPRETLFPNPPRPVRLPGSKE